MPNLSNGGRTEKEHVIAGAKYEKERRFDPGWPKQFVLGSREIL